MIDGGLLTTKRNLLEIRREEGDVLPIIAPSEVVVWHKPSGKGEFYIGSDDGGITVFGANSWSGQTFTIGEVSVGGDFECTAMKFLLQRVTGETPGIVTLDIYKTSAGKPTGAVLATGTTDGNTLPEQTSAAEERIISLVSPLVMEENVMYAGVLKCLASGVDRIVVHHDDSSPAYAGGTQISTGNAGINWTIQARDCWFEVIGEATYFLINMFGTVKQAILVDV